MSRIGKLPVKIPQGVKIEFLNGTLSAQGPQGTLDCVVPPLVDLTIEHDHVSVTRQSETQDAKANSTDIEQFSLPCNINQEMGVTPTPPPPP